MFGSCQGALRKSIDFYLSYTKTLTQQILQTQNESRILKKEKNLMVNKFDVPLKENIKRTPKNNRVGYGTFISFLFFLYFYFVASRFHHKYFV